MFNLSFIIYSVLWCLVPEQQDPEQVSLSGSMASNEAPSQIPSPPESPQGSRQATQVANDQAPQAVENQPHMAPQVVETGEKGIFEDASTEEDEDAESDQDEEDISHVPRYQQTPMHAGPYPAFPSWPGYESPPPSEVGSKRASRQQGNQQRNTYCRGQSQQQREQNSHERVGTFSDNNFAFEAPSHGRQRRSNKKTFPSGQHSASWNTPYPTYVDNDPVAVPMTSPSHGGRAKHGMPTHEHPIQVPVRVVNPGDLAPPKPEAKEKSSLRIKLDLNLDVEITLKASLRGDLTLALL